MFRNDGIPIDILERELKLEGFLFEWESLYCVLQAGDFKRKSIGVDEIDGSYGLFPDDWTQEDFEYNNKRRNK